MKKSVCMGCLLLAGATACEKQYDASDFDAAPVVVTDYDNGADFSNLHTFYIADSILLIGRSEKPEYLTGEAAAPILTAYRDGLTACGRMPATTRAEADAGLQLAYICATHHFVGYVSSPYWWLGYPGYWPPWYWGGWSAWHYPFAVHYSYTTGALLADLVDLRTAKDDDGRLPVIWHNYITGLSGSLGYDTRPSLRGIAMAFEQSPYLRTSEKN